MVHKLQHWLQQILVVQVSIKLMLVCTVQNNIMQRVCHGIGLEKNSTGLITAKMKLKSMTQLQPIARCLLRLEVIHMPSRLIQLMRKFVNNIVVLYIPKLKNEDMDMLTDGFIGLMLVQEQ